MPVQSGYSYPSAGQGNIPYRPGENKRQQHRRREDSQVEDCQLILPGQKQDESLSIRFRYFVSQSGTAALRRFEGNTAKFSQFELRELYQFGKSTYNQLSWLPVENSAFSLNGGLRADSLESISP